MNEIIIADVSDWDDPEPRGEIHRMGGRQDGSRVLLDGSYTGGLGVTVCGIEQATRGHGWWFYDALTEAQKERQQGKPVCPTCLPEGMP